MLAAAHEAGRLVFFGVHAALADTRAFTGFLAPLRKAEWVLYAKQPFGGPRGGARLPVALHPPRRHRQQPADRRDQNSVTFKWKDYRVEGPARYKTMTLPRTSSSGGSCCTCCPRACTASATTDCSPMATAQPTSHAPASCSPYRLAQKNPTRSKHEDDEARVLPRPCPCCGGRMIIIETFARGCEPKHRPTPAPMTIRIDTS